MKKKKASSWIPIVREAQLQGKTICNAELGVPEELPISFTDCHIAVNNFKGLIT